jgi:hypothetical protein
VDQQDRRDLRYRGMVPITEEPMCPLLRPLESPLFRMQHSWSSAPKNDDELWFEIVNISGFTTPATTKPPSFGVKIPESRVWDITVASSGLSNSSTVNRDYSRPGIYELTAGSLTDTQGLRVSALKLLS